MKLEDLIELAKTQVDAPEGTDVDIYQHDNNIEHGLDRVSMSLLYQHYESWSSYPVEFSDFYKMLKLHVKNKKQCFINLRLVPTQLQKAVYAEYKREEKEAKKERYGQVSSFKPKVKR